MTKKRTDAPRLAGTVVRIPAALKPTERLFRYLLAMIRSGQFPPDSRLPSLRFLADEFGLSVTAAQRCLERLENEGYATRVHGTGVFVRSPKRLELGRGERRIAVKMENNPTAHISYCAFVLEAMLELAPQLNCLLEVDYSPLPLAAFMREVAPRSEAVLVLGSRYDAPGPHFDVDCPVVGVELNECYSHNCSALSLDPQGAARLAVEYFRRRRFRHIVILHTDTPLHAEREDAFRCLWERVGTSEILTGHKPAGWPDFNSRETGFFFSSGGDYHDAAGNYFMRTGGRQLRKLRNIVSLDAKSRLIPSFEPGVTIGPDWKEVGRAALGEALRRIGESGRSPRRILLPCQLYLFNQ